MTLKFLLFIFFMVISARIVLGQGDSLILIKTSAIKPDSLSIYNSRYPNPFSPSGIAPDYILDLSYDCNLQISIYDFEKYLRTIYSSYAESGRYTLALNKLDFFKFYSSGTYFLHVLCGEKTLKQKFFITK